MGQKTNPVGIRLNIVRTWDGYWYSDKEYGNYLIEDIKIRNFIYKKIFNNKNYLRVEVSDIKIKRFTDDIHIYIHTSRPGLLIGKKGQDIEFLKNELTQLLNSKSKININITEVKKIDLDAKIIAQTVGKAIEGRVAYKRAMKQSISRTMKAGAKGIKIQVSGRLNGSDMSRCEYFKEGSIPLHTFNADIDFGRYPAQTTYGKIGVTVWVCRGIGTVDRKENELLRSVSSEG